MTCLEKIVALVSIRCIAGGAFRNKVAGSSHIVLLLNRCTIRLNLTRLDTSCHVTSCYDIPLIAVIAVVTFSKKGGGLRPDMAGLPSRPLIGFRVPLSICRDNKYLVASLEWNTSRRKCNKEKKIRPFRPSKGHRRHQGSILCTAGHLPNGRHSAP